MSKGNIHINDFLTNPEFVRWVRDPDKELEVYWLKWMEAHPEKRKDVKLAREIILGFQFEQKSSDSATKQAVLANILNGSDRDSRLSSKKTGSSDREPGRPALWDKIGYLSKVAAILLLAFAVPLAINFFNSKPSPPASVALVKTIKKSTGNGEKLNLKLPDGSMVWLNADSELQYPEKFDSLGRVVHLKGEAFFDVEKSSSWPFTVVSDNLTTTALGTSFNIKHYGDNLLSISLVSGKVKVENGLTHENILLLPGQQLKYFQASYKTVIGSFNENQVIGWKSGILQFSNASFEEVRMELEKWYGVEITVVGKPPRTWNLSGQYKNQNLDMVLQRIAYIEQLDYTINDKVVQVKF